MKSVRFWLENPANEHSISSGKFRMQKIREILLSVHCGLHRVNNEKATASSKSSENNLNNYYCWQEEEKTATW